MATLGTLTASLAAALALPGGPALPRALRRLPRLKPGDTVGLIEPAGFSDGPERIAAVKATIAGMGLVPRVGRYVGARYGYLAGTDRQRADDLDTMFADPDVRAVFAVRGGWGCARMLPLIDWKVVRANPKLLIGYSDVTALHLAFAARAGFPTIHAPNAANGWQKLSWESFWRMAFAGDTPTLGLPAPGDLNPLAPPRLAFATIHPGKARGRLLGGNLTVLAALLGTPWLPEFKNAILFIEDVGEAEYRIDRMLTQLALAGVLGRLAGVVFGQCARCTAGVDGYIGFTVRQVLEQHLARLGVPVFVGANFGHVGNQLSLPSGAEVEIDADAGAIRLLAPIVA